MSTFLWIIIGLLAFILIFGSGKTPNQKILKKKYGNAVPHMPWRYTEQKERFFQTRIAGITFRCTNLDVGAFVGVVVHQANNAHSDRAHAIIRADGKHLGYIPEDELDCYMEWRKTDEPLPCFGIIASSEEYPLFGNLAVVGNADEAELETMEFCKWVVETFGPTFLPTSVKVKGKKPLTKEAWLRVLDERIAELTSA